jgi:hypothetical protein
VFIPLQDEVTDEAVILPPPSAHSPLQTPPPLSPPQSEQSFAGDFFGINYNEGDFSWVEDDNPPDPEHHGSEDSDFEDLFLEVADPQLQPHPHQIPIHESDVELNTEDDPPIPTRTQRQAAECSTSIWVPHVTTFADRYPGTKASRPVCRSQNHHSEYAEKVADEENPWAPFQSRMDWDIAKWAKNRGPSSTAFSELLQIKGVSVHKLCRACLRLICIFPGTNEAWSFVQVIK